MKIEKVKYGYQQMNKFINNDLYHEEVVEFSEAGSIFQQKYGKKTVTLSFLLLGDQNAGKSTFIHSFTNDKQSSIHFLQLYSILPILASSFINMRFLSHKNITKADLMDELPYMDTDIAKGTILLSIESFFFFLNEYDIDAQLYLSKIPADTEYICIQLIEIGGDHFDRLIQFQSASQKQPENEFKQHIEEIMFNSNRMLSNSHKSIYFINCKTLFNPENQQIISSSYDQLVTRMNYLFSIFNHLQQPHEIILYFTRLNNVDHTTSLAKTILTRLQAENLFKNVLIFNEYHVINHIDAQTGYIKADSIASTLSYLIKVNSNMAYLHLSSLSIGYKYILTCWQDGLHLRLNQKFSLFLNYQIFAQYIDDLHWLEIPDTCILQEYHQIARLCCLNYLTIRNYRDNVSHLQLYFTKTIRLLKEEKTKDQEKQEEEIKEASDYYLWDHTFQTYDIYPKEQEYEIRFPYCYPLYQWIKKHITELWFKENTLTLADLVNQGYGAVNHPPTKQSHLLNPLLPKTSLEQLASNYTTKSYPFDQ